MYPGRIRRIRKITKVTFQLWWPFILFHFCTVSMTYSTVPENMFLKLIPYIDPICVQMLLGHGPMLPNTRRLNKRCSHYIQVFKHVCLA